MPAAFRLVGNGRRRPLGVHMEIASTGFNPLDGKEWPSGDGLDGSRGTRHGWAKRVSRHLPFAFNTSNTAAVS
jgi:hypothetical protein